MNLNFTLPVRSRPLTLPIEAANCSYDNQTISSPPKSDLKVKKRSPVLQQKPGGFENIRPEAS
jgi:hypothetical protein